VNILIVENDSYEAHLLIRNIEEQEGYKAFWASSYEESLTLLRKENISFAIIDIDLEQEKNGIEVAAYIHLHKLQIPFMFLSGNIGRDNPYYQRAMGMEPSNYIVKGELIPKAIIHYIQYSLDKFTQGEPIYLQLSPNHTLSENWIMLKNGSVWNKIALEELAYIQVHHVYCSMFLNRVHAPFEVRISLDNLMKKLTNTSIIRVNQGEAINIDLLEKYIPTENKLILKGDREFLLTRTYKQQVKDILQLKKFSF
jgi:DNA-binding LytR/AlgR family response regulator